MNKDFSYVFGKPIYIHDWREEEDFRADPGIELPEDDRTDEEIAEDEAEKEQQHDHEQDARFEEI